MVNRKFIDLSGRFCIKAATIKKIKPLLLYSKQTNKLKTGLVAKEDVVKSIHKTFLSFILNLCI